MLVSLKINNFTLIDNLELTFSENFNCIIGETGAGKSVIVDALLLALGSRASIDFIRKNENKAVIEAEFSISNNHPAIDLLIENELDFIQEDKISICTRREILLKGNSRCFINDTPVQQSVLKSLGDMLVDFHGQHDHQQLLNKDSHLDILDSVCNLENHISIYKDRLQELKSIQNSLKSLIDSRKNEEYRISEYTRELEEFNKISPKPNEDELLVNELVIIENRELLHNLTSELYSLIMDKSDSIYINLTKASKIINQLSDIDTEFLEYKDELESHLISINEIGKFANSYLASINFDDERINDIRLRLQQLRALIKKYGSLGDAIDRMTEINEKLSSVTDSADKIESLQKEIPLKQKALGDIASEISDIRKKNIKNIESKIISYLTELGITNPDFSIQIQNSLTDAKDELAKAKIGSEYYKLYKNGIDSVEFLITTNKGEGLKPLAEVASGGEISRIMLAIKSIIANLGITPILIFDEIDTGISGRIAQKVGRAMKSISNNNQVIAITHLAQIAALADNIILVKKYEDTDKTIISADILKGDEKIREIAKLISGEEVTQSTINSVKELSNYQDAI